MALHTLRRLYVGRPSTFGNLSMFALIDPAPDSALDDLLTLDEALASHKVRVHETGIVAQIHLDNRGHKPVLLLDGDELLGGSQNRILDESVVVPAQSSLTLPCRCCEQGRWTTASGGFRTAGRVLCHRGRAMKAVAANAAMRSGSPDRAQHVVWQEIADMQTRMGVASATGAVADLYDSRQDLLDGFVQTLAKPQPGQRGAVFAQNGAIIGFEVVTSALWARVASKIVRSVALDALDPRPVPPARLSRSAAAAFVLAVAAAPALEHEAVGLGTHLRLDGPGFAAAGLMMGDKLVHFYAAAV